MLKPNAREQIGKRQLVLPDVPQGGPLVLILSISDSRGKGHISRTVALDVSAALIRVILRRLLLLLIFSGHLLRCLTENNGPSSVLRRTLSLTDDHVLTLIMVSSSVTRVGY